MRITRLQLKQIILESLKNENIKKTSAQDLTVKGMGTTSQGEAVPVMQGELEKVKDILSLSRDLQSYFVWKDSNTSLDGLYKLGVFVGSKGDPYTYDKLSGSSYRVISGPKAAPVGKIFTMKKEPIVLDVESINVDLSGDVQSQSQAQTRTPTQPYTPKKYKATKEEVAAFILDFAEEMDSELGSNQGVIDAYKQLANDVALGKKDKDKELSAIWRQASPEVKRRSGIK